jgi:regulator of cell morphogenesis and NO signaling
LAAAADRAGVEVAVVLSAMSGPPRARWDCSTIDRAPVRAVVDHIETVHHGFLRREFPRAALLLDAAILDHPSDDRLLELSEAFTRLRDEMGPHLAMEEAILFPICRDLANAFSWPSFHVGPVTKPIALLQHDHDDADRLLATMSMIIDNYPGPVDAGVQAAFTSLGGLEDDLRQHLREENEALFPSTLRLAEELQAI